MAGGARVLVIEDEATQVLLLAVQLRRAGYDVRSAMTGAEGLRKALAEPPEIILLDVMLPEMNGLDVCRRLREQEATKDTPIILLTASNVTNLARQCQSYGISDCLIKPYQVDELIQRIARALASPQALLPV